MKYGVAVVSPRVAMRSAESLSVSESYHVCVCVSLSCLSLSECQLSPGVCVCVCVYLCVSDCVGVSECGCVSYRGMPCQVDHQGSLSFPVSVHQCLVRNPFSISTS